MAFVGAGVNPLDEKYTVGFEAEGEVKRSDFAAAAAAVIASGDERGGRAYELAGDTAYPLTELVAEVSRRSGRVVRYRDLPEAVFEAALLSAGLPDGPAAMLSSSRAAVAGGALHDDGGDLDRLLKRPKKPMAASVAEALGRATGRVAAGDASLGSMREIFHP